ncbi:MAG: hypothetical protein Tsb0033_22070 [Winogradskyella sp.]
MEKTLLVWVPLKSISIWFFQGMFLKDETNLPVGAQKNKTKALPQLRFKSKANANITSIYQKPKEKLPK